MSEVYEEQVSEPRDIGRYLDLIRRRHMQFLIPLFAGWLLVWGSSWFLPVRYKSVTLILVQQPTMSKNYVVPNISDDLQDRLESITQQILSRTRLMMIIDSLHLYEGGRHPLTPEDKVNLMRKDIGIDLVRDPQDNSISAFKVSFTASNAHVAQKVTSELTSLFINENLKVRQQQSEDTTHFIESQLDAARASLAEQESKVRDFQNAHLGELPSQQTTNLQILGGLQGQLQNEQDALNAARQQRVYFQTLIDQYHTMQGATRGPGGEITGGLPAIDAQLEKMRAQLADLSTHYTDQYPDIQNLKREIARTERQRQAMLKTPPPPAGAPSTATSQSAPQMQIEGQLKSTEIEIANRENAINSLKARIGEYQRRLNAQPASEQQLADLTRGYEQSKANYDDLLKKESQSQMATSMEQMQQGERFSVLDPPSLPLKPDFPNRLKMCAVGLMVGLVFGVATVAVLEFLDDRLHSEREISALLPVVVISEIPVIQNPSDERSEKRKLMLGWAVAALIFFVIAAGSAFSYLHA